MSGDTLKRVQAVKKWLEKAESSYSKHKDITGEINLIMAQAEMQRLKETRRPSTFYRWGLRGCAMIVAVGLFFGGSYLYRSTTEESHPRTASMEMVQKEVNPVSTVATKVPEKPEKEMVEIGKDTVTVSPPAESETVSANVETVTPKAELPQTAPTETTVEVPQKAAPAAPVRSAPALSEKEIQSVVGEAGRTLRGQV